MFYVQSHGHRVENMWVNGSVRLVVLYTFLLMYWFEFDRESQPMKVSQYCWVDAREEFHWLPVVGVDSGVQSTTADNLLRLVVGNPLSPRQCHDDTYPSHTHSKYTLCNCTITFINDTITSLWRFGMLLPSLVKTAFNFFQIFCNTSSIIR